MTVPTPGVPVTLIRKNKIFSLVCEVCLLTPERKKCEDYLGFRGCGYLKYYFAWAKNIIQYYLYVFLLKMREGTPGRIEPPLARCLCTTSINIPQSPPTSASYRNVRDFGKLPNDFWKNDDATTKSGFYFFTYECSWRQFPSVEIINGMEEVLILLFTAFGCEYLFWNVVARVWKVRFVIREKFLIVER